MNAYLKYSKDVVCDEIAAQWTMSTSIQIKTQDFRNENSFSCHEKCT